MPGEPALASGKLDPSYASGGVANVAGGLRMAILSDGSGFVGGRVFVAKISPIGSKIAAFDESSQSIWLTQSIALDSAGISYVLTYRGGAGASVIAYDPNLGLVPTFGAAGEASLAGFGDPSGSSTFTSLTRSARGDLIVGGTYARNGVTTMAVAKFDASGRLVPEFGNGGIATFQLAGQNTSLRAVTTDSLGNIYLAGGIDDAARGIVVKLDANGLPSAAFGTGGAWQGPACGPGSWWLESIVVDGAGNVFAGGACGGGVIVKLAANGSPVAAFREAGMRTVSVVFGGVVQPLSMVNAVLIAPSGEIYAAGKYPVQPLGCADSVLLKLDARGEPAASFGNNGSATFDIADDTPTDLGIDAVGRVYMGVRVMDSCHLNSSFATYAIYRVGG